MDLGVDIIYVINLSRHQDRKEKILNFFKNNNINNYTFINAIEGKTLSFSELINKNILNNVFKCPYGVLTKNIIGCALSHRLAIETFLNSSYNTCLILEDDIEPTEYFYKENLILLQDNLNKTKWDMFFWGKGDEKIIGIQTQYNNLNKLIPHKGTYAGHSYQLNKNSSKILLDNYFPITYAADVYLENLNLNIYSPNYSLFKQYKKPLNTIKEYESTTTEELNTQFNQQCCISQDINVKYVTFNDNWAHIYLDY
jgi:GR25 family glycosyltransferase involved in LPS biosynthesis